MKRYQLRAVIAAIVWADTRPDQTTEALVGEGTDLLEKMQADNALDVADLLLKQSKKRGGVS